jgi:hypothetical protein
MNHYAGLDVSLEETAICVVLSREMPGQHTQAGKSLQLQ